MPQVETTSPKQRVEQLLKQLPEDCTLEDIQYHLYVLQTIEERTRQADAGDFATPEEADKRMSKWIIK